MNRASADPAVMSAVRLALLITVPNLLVVHPSVPAGNVRELVAHA